jgi:hypothetical protein
VCGKHSQDEIPRFLAGGLGQKVSSPSPLSPPFAENFLRRFFSFWIRRGQVVDLEIDESNLTGETKPARKQTEEIDPRAPSQRPLSVTDPKLDSPIGRMDTIGEHHISLPATPRGFNDEVPITGRSNIAFMVSEAALVIREVAELCCPVVRDMPPLRFGFSRPFCFYYFFFFFWLV